MATRAETEPIAATRRRLAAARAGDPLGPIVKHGMLLFCCVIILFPLAWVFLLSIKSLPDAYTNRIWPHHFDFSHYRKALTAIDTLRQNIQNSIIVTLATMLITTTSPFSPATRSSTCRRPASGSCWRSSSRRCSCRAASRA